MERTLPDIDREAPPAADAQSASAGREKGLELGESAGEERSATAGRLARSVPGRRPESRASPRSSESAGAEPKERMTFRLPAELAQALRRLPNQTAFVERAVRESLGQVCPLCRGTGTMSPGTLSVSDLKRCRLGRLDRRSAAQLKALVRVGRELLATELRLEAADGERARELDFQLARDRQLLLSGRICRGDSRVVLPHGPHR